MKKIMMLALTGALLSSTPVASAASPYYPVAKDQHTAAGVYKDGKKVIAAKQSDETQPIQDVTSIKDTIFFTEYQSYEFEMICERLDLMYQLKMKKGTGKVKILAQVSGYMGNIGNDGKQIYFVAAKNPYKGNLMRITADGKTKKTLVPDVEDFWYVKDHIYYMKKNTVYEFNKKTLKSNVIGLGKGKLRPTSYCLGGTIRAGENALIYREKTTSKKASYITYDYVGKKMKRFELNQFPLQNEYIDPIRVLDVNSKRSEFIYDQGNLLLLNQKSKVLKTLLSENKIKQIGYTQAKTYESIDAVKRKITYVKGTKRFMMSY